MKEINFIKSPFKSDTVEANEQEEKSKKISNSQEKISAARLRGRTYGYCWVLLEKRDPAYDGEKLKEESPMMLVLKATNFANERELDVINKLVVATNENAASEESADPSQDQLEIIKGSLEGKLIEYNHLDPYLLLESDEIKSKND